MLRETEPTANTNPDYHAEPSTSELTASATDMMTGNASSGTPNQEVPSQEPPIQETSIQETSSQTLQTRETTSPHLPLTTDGQVRPQTSPQANGLWPVFRNRNFLTLWTGQVFSQMADKIYLVLMIAIISSSFK